MDQSVDYGSLVLLFVSATGTPPLRYRWYKDWQLISEKSDGRFQIDSAVLEDAGYYSVEVINAYGSTGADMRLNVHPRKSSILEPFYGPPTRFCFRGQSADLFIYAPGADLTYHWGTNDSLGNTAWFAITTNSVFQASKPATYLVVAIEPS
jgi:hypothetical protein